MKILSYIALLSVVLMVCLTIFTIKTKPSPIYGSPVHYAVVISNNELEIHIKFWMNDDYYISDHSIYLDENSHFILQAFSKPNSDFNKSTFNSESKHRIDFKLSDIKNGTYKIFYEGFNKNYLLGEITLPTKETKYIFSKNPYQKAKNNYREHNMLNNTKYELTDEDFYNQYWVENRIPLPELSIKDN